MMNKLDKRERRLKIVKYDEAPPIVELTQAVHDMIALVEDLQEYKEKNPILESTIIIIDLNNYAESFKRLNFPRHMNMFRAFEEWLHQTFPLIQGKRENPFQIHMFYSQYLEPLLKTFHHEYIPYCETKIKYGGKAADVDTNITGEMVWKIRNDGDTHKKIKTVYLFSGDKDLEIIAKECQKYKIEFHVIVTHKSFLCHELKNVATTVNEIFPKARLK